MCETLSLCQNLNPRSSNFQSLLEIKNENDNSDNDDDDDSNGDNYDDDDVKRLEERHP